jgi:hypothetical protein
MMLTNHRSTCACTHFPTLAAPVCCMSHSFTSHLCQLLSSRCCLGCVQGKRHQQNMAKRAAREAAEKTVAPAPQKRAAVKKTIKIGRPGYRVTKQFDQDAMQRALLFQVSRPGHCSGCSRRSNRSRSKGSSLKWNTDQECLQLTDNTCPSAPDPHTVHPLPPLTFTLPLISGCPLNTPSDPLPLPPPPHAGGVPRDRGGHQAAAQVHVCL